MSSNTLLDQELIQGFIDESQQLLEQLEEIVEQLEDFELNDDFPTKELRQFAQIIDRIMGAAQTLSMADPAHLGLQHIGRMAELCKKLGYKASEWQRPTLIPFFASFWAETLEGMGDFLKCLQLPDKTQKLAVSTGPSLQKRLNWLMQKVQEGSKQGAAGKMAQSDLDALMKDLGL